MRFHAGPWPSKINLGTEDKSTCPSLFNNSERDLSKTLNSLLILQSGSLTRLLSWPDPLTLITVYSRTDADDASV